MKPLEVLFERHGLPTFELPTLLAEIYRGHIGFDRPTLFANFVASVDGVVALPIPEESGALILTSHEKGTHLRLEGRMKGWAGILFFGLLRWRTDRLLDRFVEEL